MDGYDVIRTQKRVNRNNGALIYAKKSLAAVGRDVEIGGVIAIDLNFKYHNKPHNIIAAYRTHESYVYTFIDELKLYFAQLNNTSKSIIFIGDINIDILQRDAKSELYLDTLITYLSNSQVIALGLSIPVFSRLI